MLYDIRSMNDSQRRIEEYIHFNNKHRPQHKLNKLPPVECRKQLIA
ncbi:IS3 family transposase [Paenibacillus wynnii]